MGKKTETVKKTGTGETVAKSATADPTAAASKPAKKAAAPKKTASKTAKPVLSPDDLALRAYFISEKRQREGLPGDSHQDWLEAERQLLAELKSKKSKKASK